MESRTKGDQKDEIEEEFSFHRQRTISTQNGEYLVEMEGSESNESSGGKKLMDFVPIRIPAIDKKLMPRSKKRKKRVWDFLRARPVIRFAFIRKPRRSEETAAADGDQSSQPPPQEAAPDEEGQGRRRRFRVRFIRKINWGALMQAFKEWIKSPANIALFVWIVLVVIGVFWIFLFMVDAMDDVMPDKEQRKKWQEVINQILNALFTMICVYEHPVILHHLVLVLRWRPNDQVEIRNAYCKDGRRRPNDRWHILFAVSLLHLTCAAQYVYCALFWGWSRENRPEWPQYLLLGVGVAAPVLAGWYTYRGPLAKDIPDSGSDEEMQSQANGTGTQTHRTIATLGGHQKVVVTDPEWIGGTFDCCDDVTVSCLSFFCTFCVFGWNLERLGFGNMYVHIFTFLLLCISPFLIFNITAINVDDDTVRIIVAASGAFCCFFGLIYGGYWRTQIREKFKLPGNPFCCGYVWLTDYMQWLFCWSCSLAQEVRTANFYDIEEDGFYRKVTDEEGRPMLVPLPREGNWKQDPRRSFSSPPKLDGISPASPKDMSGGYSPVEQPTSLGKASTYSKVYAMAPPLPPVMQTEDGTKE